MSAHFTLRDGVAELEADGLLALASATRLAAGDELAWTRATFIHESRLNQSAQTAGRLDWGEFPLEPHVASSPQSPSRMPSLHPRRCWRARPFMNPLDFDFDATPAAAIPLHVAAHPLASGREAPEFEGRSASGLAPKVQRPFDARAIAVPLMLTPRHVYRCPGESTPRSRVDFPGNRANPTHQEPLLEESILTPRHQDPPGAAAARTAGEIGAAPSRKP